MEILQVERHVPKNVTRHQYPEHKPHDRQCLGCVCGTKKNTKGYKLHLDANDIGLPISALVTAASVRQSSGDSTDKADQQEGNFGLRFGRFLRSDGLH